MLFDTNLLELPFLRAWQICRQQLVAGGVAAGPNALRGIGSQSKTRTLKCVDPNGLSRSPERPYLHYVVMPSPIGVADLSAGVSHAASNSFGSLYLSSCTMMAQAMRPPFPFMPPAPPLKAPSTSFQLEIKAEELIKTSQQQKGRLKKLYGARENPRDLDEDIDSETQ
jgi:hypothetical protein